MSHNTTTTASTVNRRNVLLLGVYQEIKDRLIKAHAANPDKDYMFNVGNSFIGYVKDSGAVVIHICLGSTFDGQMLGSLLAVCKHHDLTTKLHTFRNDIIYLIAQ